MTRLPNFLGWNYAFLHCNAFCSGLAEDKPSWGERLSRAVGKYVEASVISPEEGLFIAGDSFKEIEVSDWKNCIIINLAFILILYSYY